MASTGFSLCLSKNCKELSFPEGPVDPSPSCQIPSLPSFACSWFNKRVLCSSVLASFPSGGALTSAHPANAIASARLVPESVTTLPYSRGFSFAVLCSTVNLTFWPIHNSLKNSLDSQAHG